jgi:tRNA nucleotidyltransferase (CCA-adding enzyme)
VKHKVIFKNKKFSPYSSVRKSKIYIAAKQICAILQKNKFDAYIVGGAIRDLYIRPNVVPKDLDIATSANPNDVHKIFKSSKFVGEAFGVCLVNLNNLQFEVTSFRKEGKYINKRKPENISKGTFLEDSNRRDFTINSLYYDPIKKLIIDPHNGINDIKNKIIQCVGNPNDRFQEDVLRILRMIRFAANLNFNISKESLQAAKKEIKEIYAETVSFLNNINTLISNN